MRFHVDMTAQIFLVTHCGVEVIISAEQHGRCFAGKKFCVYFYKTSVQELTTWIPHTAY